MQYAVIPVTDVSVVLGPISALAITHNYFPEVFLPATLDPAGPLAEQCRMWREHLSQLRWTIATARDDHNIVAFAATEDSATAAIKTRSIVWFLVAPDCRDVVEPGLLEYLARTDAAGCAEISIDAELDIALWRRLLRYQFRPSISRVCCRSPTGHVVDQELVAKLGQAIGLPMSDEMRDALAELRATRRRSNEVVSAINDTTTTVDSFRARFPTFVTGRTVKTLLLCRPLMHNQLFLPAGPAADRLVPFD